MVTYKPGEIDYAESLTHDDLEDIMFDALAECMDGCYVEPDGTCPHGYSSPLLVLGVL